MPTDGRSFAAVGGVIISPRRATARGPPRHRARAAARASHARMMYVAILMSVLNLRHGRARARGPRGACIMAC
jgi:hypothetical protein